MTNGGNTTSGSATTASIDRALSALNEALLEGGGGGGDRGGGGAKTQAPEKTTTDDQPEAVLTAAPTPADTDTTATSADEDGGKDVFSPAAYRKRLGTFRPMTYFAKPDEVSPLVCARFGWINSSQDMLACTSPSCRAAICVDINPSLSAESAQKLAKQYRQMLATAHTTICPFRSDAERWLLDEESKKQSEGFVVSPVLLPMADDYVLLEDLAAGGLVARKMIRAAAVRLSEHFEQANMGLSKLDVTIPRTLVKFVEKEAEAEAEAEASAGGITSDKLEWDADRVSEWIYTALSGKLKRSGEDSRDILAKEASDDDDFTQLVTNVPLLAALGWRPAVSNTDSTSDDAAVVECPLCLARTSLTSCNEPDAGDAPPMKRQRTSDGGATSSSPQPADPLSSHRHYCPYVCAASCNIEGGALPGWKGVLGMIGKQGRDKENTSTSSGIKPDKSVSTGEETFHSVRFLLRNALPSEPKA